MFGSEILEVALGLVFVYLLASTVCSAIREGIAKVLKTRAKNLEKELLDILKSTELVQALYQHQLIREPQDKEAKKRPSKISADKFAAALLDTLVNAQKGKTEGFAEMKQGIEKIENAQIRGTLLEILNSAVSDVDRLKVKIEEIRKSLEEWYDKLMDKMSLWYRKRSREVLFVIGLLLCGFLNLDTVMIVKSLHQGETLRKAAAAAATETLKESSTDTGETTADFRKRVNELRKKLDQIGIPVGWPPRDAPENDPRKFPEQPLLILLKILGIIATSLAISFGAPFWFDTMRKLSNLSGKKKTGSKTGP
jgi:hypothetical protein